MESWYGLLWKHKNRHAELLRAAERERLVNLVRAEQRADGMPPDAGAKPAAERTKFRPVPSGTLRPAEQS